MTPGATQKFVPLMRVSSTNDVLLRGPGLVQQQKNGEITRNCLSNKQVLRSLGDDNGTDKLYWLIQAANNIATHALEQAEYEAGLLKATVEKKEEDNEGITVPNTIAQQQALANARGHGGRFMVTWGMHSTSDNLFIAMEMATHHKDKERAEKDMKLCQRVGHGRSNGVT